MTLSQQWSGNGSGGGADNAGREDGSCKCRFGRRPTREGEHDPRGGEGWLQPRTGGTGTRPLTVHCAQAERDMIGSLTVMEAVCGRQVRSS